MRVDYFFVKTVGGMVRIDTENAKIGGSSNEFSVAMTERLIHELQVAVSEAKTFKEKEKGDDDDNS